jgi:hypothetical protein
MWPSSFDFVARPAPAWDGPERPRRGRPARLDPRSGQGR